VSNLEKVVDEIRSSAGADFAFILTRRGRLVTSNAPREMPDVGRDRLAAEADALIGTQKVAAVTMPREDLVPYGGAAPVDVYVGVAGEQAVVCVVMATWADKSGVLSALAAGLQAMEPMITAFGQKLRRRKGGESQPPPPGARPRAGSAPQITLGEAPLGRESLAAIERDTKKRAGSAPHITIHEASLGRESVAAIERDTKRRASAGSTPHITLGEAPLGRETLVALEREARPPLSSMPERVRVALESVVESDLRATPNPDSPRMTQPWVESPADSLRAAEAARLGRKLAPPKVTLKLDDLDEELREAARREAATPQSPAKSRRRRT
jgi:hypothetical protein